MGGRPVVRADQLDGMSCKRAPYESHEFCVRGIFRRQCAPTAECGAFIEIIPSPILARCLPTSSRSASDSGCSSISDEFASNPACPDARRRLGCECWLPFGSRTPLFRPTAFRIETAPSAPSAGFGQIFGIKPVAAAVTHAVRSIKLILAVH